MSMTVEKLVEEALDLPTHARAFIAEKLIESLDVDQSAEISPAWQAEIQKRCRDIDNGLVELRDAETVFRKAYTALG